VGQMQNIVCKKGICVDMDNLSCEEKFKDITKVIECELLEEEY
tara:strand:+ start:546 stop:674 length:129 start_codon:yes stop_codon:yes gene_type:complete